MKQVIGVFMVLVMVFLVVSIALGYEVTNVSEHEAFDMVLDWARCQGWDDWANREPDSFALHGCGVVSVKWFEQESGMDWSIENFKEYYSKEGETTEFHLKQVGYIEGLNVYLLEAKSETKVLGSRYNEEKGYVEDYYIVSVLFVICESYE